jgi:thioredoxin-like negative regulator of GroEL
MWINKNNYNELLKGITVIEVSGESCANCISLMNVLNIIESNRKDFTLLHLEAEESTQELLEKFKIETIPTVLVMYNQEIEARCRGYQPEEILELWLEAKINDIKKKHSL